MVTSILLGIFVFLGFILGILILLTQLGSLLDPDAKREYLRNK